jgi:hypothetical protein
MLQNMGYSSKLPTAIRHGPTSLGGLDLLDLRTELGITNLKFMRDSIYRNSAAGTLIILNAKYSQIESGLSEPLLEHPSLHVSYLTPSWVMSVRQFLFQHNLTVTLTDTLRVELRGPNDKCIMDLEALTRYTPIQQKDINLVRLHLQVITLSDMSTSDGKAICPLYLEGSRRPDQKIQLQTWPRQEPPTGSQRRLWKTYVTSLYLRYSTTWKNKLLPYAPHYSLPTQISPPTSNSHFPTHQAHIKSLPTWYRRLLFDYTQIATDLEVWRSFRNKRRLIIASDGSLHDTAGTFGWKITTPKHLPLFHGSGPVDGPIEIGSSALSAK